MKKKTTVLNYTVVFEEDPAGGYAVWVPELSGCASQGESLDEAKKNIQEAIELYLEDASPEIVQEAQKTARQFIVPVSVSISSYGQSL
ncbi:MAG: type II toxin-antitoxin system HicB family antitoxin [Patescibacteria group bacterium]